MSKFLRILVSIGAVLVTAGEVRAQVDNRAFFGARPGDSRNLLTQRGFGTPPQHPERGTAASPERGAAWFADSASARAVAIIKRRSLEPPMRAGDLNLAINAFTFFKDNEYFNKIVDGYTLFGTQLNPQLVYYPTKDLRLEAGIFLWKDFGNPVLQQVRPTYRATWTVKNHQFIFGNIRPHLNHNYIEPLFNFERVMLKPLEEGVQYRHLGNRLFVDVWVDWQRQQYRYSNFQEEIAGGISGSYRLTPDQSAWQVAVPFQFTATHHGGQIDTLNKPLQTLFNEALGLEVRRSFGREAVHAIRLNAYALGFQDHSFTFGQLPFKNGTALYLNGTLETKYADVMLSYFEGEHFIAPLGGDLYQGLSRTVSDPNYTETVRRVLLLRLLRDFRISDAAALTVRVEPVYDFKSRKTDFSFGFYLNFRQEWLLGNVGNRARP